MLPDIEFLTNDFYRDPSFIDTIPYDKKIARAVFSGSTTGGHITPSIARALSLPRLRAAGYFQGNERVDFRLPNIVQAGPEAQAMLETMPFCRKPRLDWTEQLNGGLFSRLTEMAPPAHALSSHCSATVYC